MLEATGVHKAYGEVEALRGVDLKVEAGQIVALLGRNGAGKTTLVSIIAGLLRSDAGSVHIDGADAAGSPTTVARMIGIAPQETGIYRVLTVRENLEFFCDLAGVGRRLRTGRVNSVAEQLGLADLLGRKASQLSGGEARRLHTACALVIIHDGRTLDRGTRADLIERHHQGGLWFSVEGEPPSGVLDGLDVRQTQTDGADGHQSYLVAGDVRMSDIVQRFGANASQLVSVQRNLPDLESVFMAVTGVDGQSDPDQAAPDRSGPDRSTS